MLIKLTVIIKTRAKFSAKNYICVDPLQIGKEMAKVGFYDAFWLSRVNHLIL